MRKEVCGDDKYFMISVFIQDLWLREEKGERRNSCLLIADLESEDKPPLTPAFQSFTLSTL